MADTPQPESDGHGPLAPHREPAGWLSREQALALVLLGATALALYLCYRLAHPFLPALAWALALAVVAHPLYAWLLSHLNRPNVAAGFAVVLVTVLLMAPTLFMLTHLGREVAEGVDRLQTDAASGRWRAVIERHPRLAPVLHWLETHVNVRGEVDRAVSALTDRFTRGWNLDVRGNDRLLDTNQAAWERSRAIVRSAEAHDSRRLIERVDLTCVAAGRCPQTEGLLP